MGIEPQHPRPQRFRATSDELRALEREVGKLSDISRKLIEGLPSITQVVIATEPRVRATIRRSLVACDEAHKAEQNALDILKGRGSSEHVRRLSQDFEGRRKYLKDLVSRAEDLFVCGKEFPAHVPITSKAQVVELLAGLHEYRALFWNKLYQVPGVQRFALERLRQVGNDEVQPSYVLHYGSIGKPNEKSLRKVVREVVARVDERMAEKVSADAKRSQREEIALLLMRAPLDPADLSEQLLTLRAWATELADLEIALACSHGSLRVRAVKADPRYAQWRELSDVFGGGALVAREMVARLTKAQEPYVRIKQYLTTANFSFVQKLVSNSKRYHSLATDMMQEGALGFMRALDKFDPKSGFGLLTYAGFWVKQRAARGFETQAPLIYLPNHVRTVLKKVSADLSQGQRPDLAASAKRVGAQEEELQALLPLTYRAVSLDSNPIGSDTPLRDYISDRGNGSPQSDEFPEDRANYRERMLNALQTLEPRERAILILRFGLDGKGQRTLVEVAHEMKVTRERIRQLQNRALEYLKEGPAARQLQQLVEDME
ncbi:MAG: polymerase sigma factor RpoD [Pseudomonadota bacterium]|jgi:RNA polymerase primary sigma factor